MDSSPISSPIGTPVASTFRDFCVDPKELRNSRTDDRRAVVPRKGDYFGMSGIEECWIDVWGEEICSLQTRLRPVAQENSLPERSCTKAQQEDPETFEYMRKEIETDPWTITEMRKAMKWIFNCTGKIPAKVCN